MAKKQKQKAEQPKDIASDSRNYKKATDRKKILIVGDWEVEEKWSIGIHRSRISSRTGYAHYRSLHSLQNNILALGGAGRVASIIHNSRLGSRQLCDVIGIGIWHKDDTIHIESLFDQQDEENLSHHCLNSAPVKHAEGVRLLNLGEHMPKKDSYGTNRIVRIYQHTRGLITLLHRYDWELPVYVDKTKWITSEETLQSFAMHHLFSEEEQQEVDAVIIKDAGKGVVSKSLIRRLINSKIPKDVPWFVSSSEWLLDTDWYEDLQHVNLRLVVIPQHTTENAVRDGKVTTWFTNTGFVSKEALDELDKFTEGFQDNRRPAPIVVALPEKATVLTRYACRGDDDHAEVKGIIQLDKQPSSMVLDSSMSSSFFPALIVNLLNTVNSYEDVSCSDFQQIIKQSFSFMESWRRIEAKKVENPREWRTTDEPKLDLFQPYEKMGVWKKPFPWELSKVQWDQAFSNYGIIHRKDNKEYIDLWRSMNEVNGYTAIVNGKRSVLQKLVKEARGFQDNPYQTRCCMLIASPGSGKTFLMKRLAKSQGMRFMPFNITQMLSKSDILDCFDTIVTSHAQNRNEPLLVFIDEINAMLNGQPVYDTFLAPLEEGVYDRAGKTFNMPPCFWIFAGTERPVKPNDPEWNKSNKASDFESRLTMPPLNLEIDVSRSDEVLQARLEKVYLGVTMLMALFPDVQRVSKKVLRTFHSLQPDLGMRELKHFVRSFREIKLGEVVSENVPFARMPADQKHMGIDITDWRTWEEGQMVEIRG